MNNSNNIKLIWERLNSNRQQTGDIVFLVESQQIRAHRSVLAAISPKYNAQFYGPNPDVDEIHIPCVSAAAFNVFVQFFYEDKVDLTMDNIEAVLDLVKQSLVDEFIETCVNFLKSQIQVNKLCIPYRLANLYDIESLRLECDQRIAKNTMDIFATVDFLQYDRDMLLHILKIDTLNCKEKDVFAACIAWARAQCKRDNLDYGQPENLRAALGDAIYQIRFSSLSAEEFAELHKSMEGFFTADESIELLYITAKLKDFESQKFNLTLRTSMDQSNTAAAQPSSSYELKEHLKLFDENPEWSLQCNRFSRINWRGGKTDISGRSRFSFSCDEPIRLHGIALAIQLENANVGDFRKSFSTKFKRYINIYQSPTRKNEIMIIFPKPIEHLSHFACSFELPFPTMSYEFELESSVEMNDIEFSFNGKWVTCIYFEQYSDAF